MLLRVIYVIIICSLSATAFAQKGFTKYKLTKTRSSRPSDYHIHDGVLYFSTISDMNNYDLDLWMMDGTTPKKIGKGKDGGPFPNHRIIGGREDILYLLTTHYSSPNSAGLYAYNIPKDTLTPIQLYDNHPFRLETKENGAFYYHIYDANFNRICKYDIIKDKIDTFLVSGNDTAIGNIHRAHNNYYVSCSYKIGNNTLYALHLVDTINHTVNQQPILAPVAGKSMYIYPINVGTKMYFIGGDQSPGIGLFEYDGTNAPKRVTDVGPSNNISFEVNFHRLVEYRNRIYFTASSKIGRLSLYTYDIATSKTWLVYKNNQGLYKEFDGLDYYVYNNRLYMSGNDGSNLQQPYVYDGADTPRRLDVLQIPNGIVNKTFPKQYIEYQGDLYFSANDSFENVELWRYNDSALRPVPPLDVYEHLPTYLSATTYPNPVTQDAHIDIQLKNAETIAVQLTDINGRMVYSQESKIYSSGSHTIDLPTRELPTGMYVYKLTDNKGLLLHSGKLLKQ